MPTELPPTSQVIRNIHETLAGFCAHCSNWESEFESLLAELDQLDLMRPDGGTGEADAGGTLGGLERRVAKENGQLMQQQHQISQDLADLRKLVIEQTETFTVLLKSGSDA